MLAARRGARAAQQLIEKDRLIRHQKLSIELLLMTRAKRAALVRRARADLRWIRAGIASGFVSLPKVNARIATTTFLDAEEEAKVRKHVQADRAWFETLRKGRVAKTTRRRR